MLGTSRPRNYGLEDQQIALAITLKQHSVAYDVRGGDLWLAGHRGEITLPFEHVASLANVSRGRWEARSLWDGRVLAEGVSQRDVVRATIQEVWN